MPKIPIPNIPRLPEHQDNAVHFNSAPGLDWNVDHSDPGQGWRDLGRGALRAGLSIGGDLMDLAERKKDAEDNDNFRELELLELRAENDLVAHMRENPDGWNDYARMNANWREERQQKQQELLDKMSPKTRKAAEFFIQKNYIRQDAMVEQYSYQGFATAKMTNLDNQTAELAKMGGQKELAFRFIDDAVLDGVLTQEMADARKEHFMEQDDFFRARELIEAGDPDILGKLNKKSGDSYSEFTHLTREQREQLKRYGEQKQVERENEMDDDVLVSFRSGKPKYATKTQLDDALEKKEITKKQYNKYSNWLEDYNTTVENNTLRVNSRHLKGRTEAYEAELVTGGKAEFKTFDELKDAYQSGRISAEEFNNLNAVLSRYESANASAAKARQTEIQQAQARQATETKEQVMWEVYQTNFSSNSNIAVMQAKELRDEADRRIKDFGDLEAVHQFIDQRMNDVLNGRNEFATTEGKIVSDWIDSTYLDRKNWLGKKRDIPKFEKLYYDPDGFKNKVETQEFQEARFYELKDKARQLLRDGNRSGAVIQELKGIVGELNDGAISVIMEPEKQSRVHRIETPKPGESLMFIPREGRYAIFDADRKFVRWAETR